MSSRQAKGWRVATYDCDDGATPFLVNLNLDLKPEQRQSRLELGDEGLKVYWAFNCQPTHAKLGLPSQRLILVPHLPEAHPGGQPTNRCRVCTLACRLSWLGNEGVACG